MAEIRNSELMTADNIRLYRQYSAYDNIGGDGERVYTATLLYDRQLSPVYEDGVQVRGGVITGIEFRR